MVAIVETPVWETEVYQLETDDPVLGGVDGIDNLQAKQLGNRTQYLKEQVELRTTVADVAAQIAALVDSSPAALNTLNELAAALGDDANFSATINNALALKAPLASPAFTNVPTAPTAAPGTNNQQLANTAFVQALFSTMTAISDATTLVKGILKTATDLLTQAGADDTTAVTPASLSSRTATEARTGLVEKATPSEAATFAVDKYIDGERLRDAFNATGAAPFFACRAWVNFNGTGTVAIKASGNVSSITDDAAGIHIVNFNTAMPDVNYATVVTGTKQGGPSTESGGVKANQGSNPDLKSTTQVKILFNDANGNKDLADISVSIFR